jgi:hypothetical protein
MGEGRGLEDGRGAPGGVVWWFRFVYLRWVAFDSELVGLVQKAKGVVLWKVSVNEHEASPCRINTTLDMGCLFLEMRRVVGPGLSEVNFM